jgi:hypothetical protein
VCEREGVKTYPKKTIEGEREREREGGGKGAGEKAYLRKDSVKGNV